MEGPDLLLQLTHSTHGYGSVLVPGQSHPRGEFSSREIENELVKVNLRNRTLLLVLPAKDGFIRELKKRTAVQDTKAAAEPRQVWGTKERCAFKGEKG